MLPRCAVFSAKAFNNGNCVFFGEPSRFLLPEFYESIKFTVHPIPYCVSVLVSANDCS